MDTLAFTAQVLPSVVAVAAMALSAVHVKNATAVAADAQRMVGDALASMHGSFANALPKLIAASPVLLKDAGAVVGDLLPPGSNAEPSAQPAPPAAAAA